MKHKLNVMSAAIVVALLAGCNSDNDVITAEKDESATLKILHINDHHSKLDASEGTGLNLGGVEVEANVGGFPILKTAVETLSEKGDTDAVIKLHGGDAITGTMYYSLMKDELPDAEMMNEICFDAFAFGNHEFDDGNEQLAKFIDKLHSSTTCAPTPALAANVHVPDTNVLAGKYEPYTILDTAAGKIGIIGIDIAGKTKNSSSPDEDTTFGPEVPTAQIYIDELNKQGVEKIVLLTHYGLDNDIEMAAKLNGVDVIVGGDSHSLMGDFSEIGLAPHSDQYPLVVENQDGDKTCIVQAYDNARVLGELNITFNADGTVANCNGTPHLLLGELTEDQVVAGDGEDKQALLADARSFIAVTPELTEWTENEEVAEKLAVHKEAVDEAFENVIGEASNNLCNERIPGQRHSSGAPCGDSGADREFLDAHSSVMGNIVAKAFNEMSNRSELAIQNSGGVRDTILEGDVTVGAVNTVLPFTNVLVNLDMTGEEIVNTLEDAIDFSMSDSDGAFPLADNLRFDVDMNLEKGQRVTNVEVKNTSVNSAQELWEPIVLTEMYVVATSDYIASGKDGYESMKDAFEDPDRMENTGLLYTDSLIKYVEQVEAEGGTLDVPVVGDMSLQNYVPLPQHTH